MEDDGIKTVNEIMCSFSIHNFGIASFDAVKNRLLPCRAAKLLPENSASVIVAVFPYKTHEKQGNLSRYCSVPDYHTVVGLLLKKIEAELTNCFPDNSFHSFCDSSPIPEVFAANLADLGVIGKNGLLITPEFGSFVFIGEIVTDLVLPISKKEEKNCLSCGLCVKFCPSGAIKKDGILKESCVSFISQKKGELSDLEQELLIKTNSVFGCDLCQEVCPMNKNARISPLSGFSQNIKANLTLSEIEDDHFNEKNSDRAFLWRGKAVLKRNLCILDRQAENTKD